LRAVDLVRAEEARAALRARMARLMERYDVLAMPSVVVEPFGVDEIAPPGFGVDDLSWLAWASASYPANLTGQPAVTVPAGFAPSGLPVGLQLVGRWHEDGRVLALAAEIERALPWHDTYRKMSEKGRLTP
jgi:aspartyl-tRNA(Asn)/glutamyl-tRNA(Gln) amidotransferase subunit A